MKYQIIILLQLLTYVATAQMTPQIVLKKTIHYHDPQGNWSRFNQRLHFTVSMPNQTDTFSIVELDNRRRYFKYMAFDGKRKVEKGFNDGNYFATIDGKNVKIKDDIKRFRMNRNKVEELRDFFTYILGLPMRLTDNGAQLSPKLHRETFNGEECWVLRVDYTPSVGNESWVYYVSTKNFAMRGCRFLRNGDFKNGAYLIFDGENTIQGIRLPNTRHWFWNADDHFLASETIESSQSLTEILLSGL
jgi:Family of unknown function (DUF6503)